MEKLLYCSCVNFQMMHTWIAQFSYWKCNECGMRKRTPKAPE